jgi:hypothetical protein
MSRNVLTTKEAFILAEQVQAHYTESGLTNHEFAAQITATMGEHFRRPITPSHIKNMLLAFDIKPNFFKISPYGARRNEEVQLIMARISALEEQMDKLTKFLRKPSL